MKLHAPPVSRVFAVAAILVRPWCFSSVSQSSHITSSVRKQFGRAFVFYTRQLCVTLGWNSYKHRTDNSWLNPDFQSHHCMWSLVHRYQSYADHVFLSSAATEPLTYLTGTAYLMTEQRFQTCWLFPMWRLVLLNLRLQSNWRPKTDGRIRGISPLYDIWLISIGTLSWVICPVRWDGTIAKKLHWGGGESDEEDPAAPGRAGQGEAH